MSPAIIVNARRTARPMAGRHPFLIHGHCVTHSSKPLKHWSGRCSFVRTPRVAMKGYALTWMTDWMQGLGQVALLAKDVICSLFSQRLSGRDLLYQMYFIGVKSQAVVLITGAFTGMVLA